MHTVVRSRESCSYHSFVPMPGGPLKATMFSPGKAFEPSSCMLRFSRSLTSKANLCPRAANSWPILSIQCWCERAPIAAKPTMDPACTSVASNASTHSSDCQANVLMFKTHNAVRITGPSRFQQAFPACYSGRQLSLSHFRQRCRAMLCHVTLTSSDFT